MSTLIHEIETMVETDSEFEQVDSMLKRVIENPTAGLVHNDGAAIAFEEHGVESITRTIFVLGCASVY